MNARKKGIPTESEGSGEGFVYSTGVYSHSGMGSEAAGTFIRLDCISDCNKTRPTIQQGVQLDVLC